MDASCNHKITFHLFVHFCLVLFVVSSCLENNIKLCLGDRNIGARLKCIKTEREALLPFHSLDDEDCCEWPGVRCNHHGHVVELNFGDFSISDGKIPPYLGNLSRLQYLDLGGNSTIWGFYAKNPDLLSALSSLKYLNLGGVELNGIRTDWLQAINKIPSLQELHLSGCGIQSLAPYVQPVNLTSLKRLDVSENSIISLPHWLFNLSSLQVLDLSWNFINSPIPGLLGNFCSLQSLKLSMNNFPGQIHEFLETYSGCPNKRLLSLNLADNFLVGNLPESFQVLENLRFLDLSNNHFSGSIPTSVGNLSSLEFMDLSSNEMNGTISESFGKLSKLLNVDLRDNSWQGVLTEAHLMNLTSLVTMALTTDTPRSLVFNVPHEWIPPFMLKSIELENCSVGPAFPMWLQTQSELTYATLKNVEIVGTIPEEWFSRLSSQINYLDLSNNKIKGKLPASIEFPYLDTIDLSTNCFEGPMPLWSIGRATKLQLQENLFSGRLPKNFGEKMALMKALFLSGNNLNGSLPLSICKMECLEILSLGSNRFSGKIPKCWNKMQSLSVVDISNNSLSGRIPSLPCSQFASSQGLSILKLNNNNLSGKIPSSLQKCTQLMSIDLGGNRLSGDLSSWMGELSSLFIVRLRSNLFRDNIPEQLCNLQNLRFLDLSHNNFSGAIPKCLNKLIALVYGNYSNMNDYMYDHQLSDYKQRALVVTKGREWEYSNTLAFVNIIDLSRNNLTGGIPDEIWSVASLNTLNLSMNRLSGSISEKLGNLRSLETLDLSQNHLSGPIPQNLSSLTFLSHLNLSHNNLVGRIPSGNQLQTLTDSSIYEGNPLLCGVPLQLKCPEDENSSGNTFAVGGGVADKNRYYFDTLWFYVSVILGFFFGFWGVCGTLLLKKT